MDEAVLRRPVGGPRGDARPAPPPHRGGRAAARHLQVVPFRRGGHAAAGGSFTVLRFEEPDLPDVVYIEQLTSALYLDQRADVDHYMEVMNRAQRRGPDPGGHHPLPRRDHPGDLGSPSVTSEGSPPAPDRANGAAPRHHEAARTSTPAWRTGPGLRLLAGRQGQLRRRPGGRRRGARRPTRTSCSSVRANRAFLARAVRYLAAEAGIRQFLDIGTGIPTADNTHEVAQAIAPGAAGRLRGQRPDRPGPRPRPADQRHREGATDYIDADLRDTGADPGRGGAGRWTSPSRWRSC